MMKQQTFARVARHPYDKVRFLPLLLCVAACGGAAATEPATDTLGADFVAVSKALSADASRLRHGVVGSVASLPNAETSFYVAIRKDLLDTRWFLSGYMKQFHPDNRPLVSALGTDQLLADGTVGTRVVSFQVQNEQLFVFDASDRFQQSDLQDPSILVEAYPIVDDPAFDALPGAGQYILFDPARGLNDFHVVSQVYADPFLDGSWYLQVGVSFLQNFRVLPDGAAFEQVFAGQLDLGADTGTLQAWGTLGVALRRYQVGEGYVPTRDPGTPFYLPTGDHFVPGSGGVRASTPIRWNFQRGMQPVEVFVSAGAARAQAAFPGVDILGAIRRGIESWNDAFGFPVLHATFTDDDQIRDDGESFVLIDYPAPNRTSHGNVQVNANNGEIRAANVYIASGTFNLLVRLGLGAPGVSQVARSAPSSRLEIGWASEGSARASCDYQPPAIAAEPGPSAAPGPSLAEQGAAWVQGFVVHEIGHALGLRHNFKGSLQPPGGTSVMDYQTLADSVALPFPGSYDVAAIRYLYQLSTELPTQPFCTDEDLSVDPTCAQYDSGASPLQDFWVPNYTYELGVVLDSGVAVDDSSLAALNGLLAFARDDAQSGVLSAQDRLTALRAALGRSVVPMAAEDAAQPAVVAAANQVADFVLRRAVLDPSEDRGDIDFDITDPDVLRTLAEQAGQMLRNTDGVRGYALRRTSVDVLAALQTDDALVQLSTARAELAAGAEQLPAAEQPLSADLRARMDAALSPYFH